MQYCAPSNLVISTNGVSEKAADERTATGENEIETALLKLSWIVYLDGCCQCHFVSEKSQCSFFR